jgi:hypothetical protein
LLLIINWQIYKKKCIEQCQFRTKCFKRSGINLSLIIIRKRSKMLNPMWIVVLFLNKGLILIMPRNMLYKKIDILRLKEKTGSCLKKWHQLCIKDLVALKLLAHLVIYFSNFSLTKLNFLEIIKRKSLNAHVRKEELMKIVSENQSILRRL